MYTYGIEEEFLVTKNGQSQICPPELFTQHQTSFTCHKEIHSSVIETVSPILDNLKAVNDHIAVSRHWVSDSLQQYGMQCFSGGTHPTICWKEETLTQNENYQKTIDEYQDLVKRNFVFGQHLHVGYPNETLLVHIFNRTRALLPFFIALSANSPSFSGRDTGLKCYRLAQFSTMPRTGIPVPMISIENTLNEINVRMATGCMDKQTSMWHDIRYHPIHGTLELRVSDMQSSTVGSQACALIMLLLMQKTEYSIHQAFYSGMPDWIIQENRWRAIRYGTDAKFILPNLEQKTFRQMLSLFLNEAGDAIRSINPDAYHWLNQKGI
jgi:carboxylate-amine ligase